MIVTKVNLLLLAILCPKILKLVPVDAYNASVILNCLHTPIILKFVLPLSPSSLASSPGPYFSLSKGRRDESRKQDESARKEPPFPRIIPANV